MLFFCLKLVAAVISTPRSAGRLPRRGITVRTCCGIGRAGRRCSRVVGHGGRRGSGGSSSVQGAAAHGAGSGAHAAAASSQHLPQRPARPAFEHAPQRAPHPPTPRAARQPGQSSSAHLRLVQVLVDQKVLGAHNHAACSGRQRACVLQAWQAARWKELGACGRVHSLLRRLPAGQAVAPSLPRQRTRTVARARHGDEHVSSIVNGLAGLAHLRRGACMAAGTREGAIYPQACGLVRAARAAQGAVPRATLTKARPQQRRQSTQRAAAQGTAPL